MILYVVREEDEDDVDCALDEYDVDFEKISDHPDFKDMKDFAPMPMPEHHYYVDDVEIELCHYGKQLATTKYDFAHIYQQFYSHVKECNVCKPKEVKE